jgi:6-phosphogluconolactonase (cycloisomerase 2 family)
MNSKARAAQMIAVGAAALASAAFVAPSASAQTWVKAPTARSAGIVFAQSDSVTGNTVTAYRHTADDGLRTEGTYATGGIGGKLGGAVVDNLGSTGSLKYDSAHGLLYAVNAGSNTVTVFGVQGDHLVRRQVLPTEGQFPVSVTVHGNSVYVLNALGGGSVQGYRTVAGHLVLVPSQHRQLGLDPNATPQFTHTPGQIQFSPNGDRLLVTTKSNTDSILVFDVTPSGELSAQPTVTTAPGTDPYSMVYDAAGRVLTVEGVPNSVATYQFAGGDHLVKTSDTATGQQASCWIVRDGQFVYVGNAGSATISEYHENRAGQLTAIGTVTTDPGTVDLAVSSNGRHLYAQTGGTGVVDAFTVQHDGTLVKTGSAVVPNGVGGEGLAAL